MIYKHASPPLPYITTWRCVLFLAWWATTGGSSKGSCVLHSPLVSILPGKGPAESQSECCLQRRP